MSSSIKNLAVILGLVTMAFAGYYLYQQKLANSPLSFIADETTNRVALQNTQVFIERRQQLEQIDLEVSFFDDERLRALKKYNRDVVRTGIGRPDPFAEIDPTTVTRDR